jgi:DNA-binding FadR family transcriptional regulator
MTELDAARAEDTNQVLRVVNDLVSFIRYRRFEPGERLPSERDLTQRFSVGRGVVREALAFLEATRYIERRRNSGIYLSSQSDTVSLESLVLYASLGIPLDREVLLQSVEVRRILEVQAVSLACARRTDADLAALDDIIARSEQALANAQSIADLDYEFHMAIFRSTQNAVFVRMVTPFYLMSRSRRDAFFADRNNGTESHRQHVELVAIIRARDAAAAAELMENHIGRVEQHYLTGTARS